MKSIQSEGYLAKRLPREVQLRRVRNVISKELTKAQREILTAYYFQEMNIPQIARIRGVHKSTVSRTLRRAEERLQKCLKY